MHLLRICLALPLRLLPRGWRAAGAAGSALVMDQLHLLLCLLLTVTSCLFRDVEAEPSVDRILSPD